MSFCLPYMISEPKSCHHVVFFACTFYHYQAFLSHNIIKENPQTLVVQVLHGIEFFFHITWHSQFMLIVLLSFNTIKIDTWQLKAVSIFTKMQSIVIWSHKSKAMKTKICYFLVSAFIILLSQIVCCLQFTSMVPSFSILHYFYATDKWLTLQFPRG